MGNLIPTRQSLLSRLKDWNDQESWKVFFDTYWRLIYRAATGAGLNDAEAQDVVQETVIAVMKAMPTFKYNREKGSFRGFLMRTTCWRIRDRIRERAYDDKLKESITRAALFTIEEEGLVDPISETLEATWAEEWEKNLMEAANERVRALVNPKLYQIYDLTICKKMSASKVAGTLGVSTTRVNYATYRVSKLIKKEILHLREKLF